MKRIALALALSAVALVAISAGTALAAPTGAPNARWVTATCGEDQFTMVVNGNGAFPAAHDVSSTRVFVPVWFGETTVTGSDKSVQTFPEGRKGSAAPKGHTLITCSWTGDPEEFEGVLYTANGTVGGFFA